MDNLTRRKAKAGGSALAKRRFKVQNLPGDRRRLQQKLQGKTKAFGGARPGRAGLCRGPCGMVRRRRGPGGAKMQRVDAQLWRMGQRGLMQHPGQGSGLPFRDQPQRLRPGQKIPANALRTGNRRGKGIKGLPRRPRLGGVKNQKIDGRLRCGAALGQGNALCRQCRRNRPGQRRGKPQKPRPHAAPVGPRLSSTTV